MMKSDKFATLNRRALKAALASALVLGASGLAVNAYAVGTTATASATVVDPMAFTDTGTLNFGKFTKAAGTIIVAPNGDRSATVMTALLLANSTHAAGILSVTGAPSATYSIGLAEGTLSGPTGSTAMTLNTLVAADSGATGTSIVVGTLTSSGTQTLKIGGSLVVAADQASGAYAGTYGVTLNYN